MDSGRLKGSRNPAELSVSSRLVADLIAEAYDQAFKEHALGRLLDLGCGEVPLYEAYRCYVSEVECIDWANSPHGADHVDKICDLAGPIPYEDGSFDTILLSDVLEHLPEPLTCWREMNRLLKAGGKVILNVPFLYQIHEEPHDYYRYTEFALRRFAENSGFRIERLVPVGGGLEVLADLLAKLFAGARLKPVAVAIQSVAQHIRKTEIGVRVTRRTEKRFPLGYFMVAVKDPRPIRY